MTAVIIQGGTNKVYATLARSRTIFYTPDVAGSLRVLREDISDRWSAK